MPTAISAYHDHASRAIVADLARRLARGGTHVTLSLRCDCVIGGEVYGIDVRDVPSRYGRSAVTSETTVDLRNAWYVRESGTCRGTAVYDHGLPLWSIRRVRLTASRACEICRDVDASINAGFDADLAAERREACAWCGAVDGVAYANPPDLYLCPPCTPWVRP